MNNHVNLNNLKMNHCYTNYLILWIAHQVQEYTFSLGLKSVNARVGETFFLFDKYNH